jgi:hypothetical protein
MMASKRYNPDWGRYTQSDPVGEMSYSGHSLALRIIGKTEHGLPAESLLFGYADSNSLRRYDPLGLYSINENCQGCKEYLPGIGINKREVIAGILLTKRLIQKGCVQQSAITDCMLERADPSSALIVNCPEPGANTRCDDPMVDSSGFAQRGLNTVNICPKTFPSSPYGIDASKDDVAKTFFEELAHVCGATFAAPDQGRDIRVEAFANYYSGKCGN